MLSWLILNYKKNMKKNEISQKPWYCYLLTQFDTFSRGDNLINVVVDIIQKVRGHRFLRWIIPQLQLLYHLSPKTTNSKVVYFCKDKTTVTYIKLLILSKKEWMQIHGSLNLDCLIHYETFLFSELPLLQVVAIVIACLVSAAILGLLCLFLCK